MVFVTKRFPNNRNAALSGLCESALNIPWALPWAIASRAVGACGNSQLCKRRLHNSENSVRSAMFIAHRSLSSLKLRRSDMLLFDYQRTNDQNMPLLRSSQNKLMECGYKHFTPNGVVCCNRSTHQSCKRCLHYSVKLGDFGATRRKSFCIVNKALCSC